MRVVFGSSDRMKEKKEHDSCCNYRAIKDENKEKANEPLMA